MKLRIRDRISRRGILLVEMMMSLGIGVVVLGVLTYASIGISRSLSATERYIVGVANENRLMDYVAADLRRALRVSVVSGGTTTVLKETGTTSYNITETTILAIRIPDYYGSNTNDNSAGSAFKTTRYARSTLNTSSTYNGNGNTLLNGIVPWADAQTIVVGKKVTRFAPSSAGTGEIEVRYYRGVRSGTDSTRCFFRSEYPVGSSTPTSTVEVAERISDGLSTTTLLIMARNGGQVFRLQSSFTPTYSRQGASSASTTGIIEVCTRNLRRD
jgi:hypothetical protein